MGDAAAAAAAAAANAPNNNGVTNPVYVTQTSVAVMTSPTLNLSKQTSSSMTSLLNNSSLSETTTGGGGGGVSTATPLTSCNTIPRYILQQTPLIIATDVSARRLDQGPKFTTVESA